MNIPFMGNWRKKRGPSLGVAVLVAGDEHPGPEHLADLLGACELLRAQAAEAGVRLDESAASLEALDQIMPAWRDDPEKVSDLGNDAGLYLGTVVVRTVPGAVWALWPNGHPVVRLASGREFDVVEAGLAWADSGVPELSQLYAEVAES
ncbi:MULTISPECIES: DUF6278 family protein [Streptomyces]|uniref:DUF6278 family protein n=1 Tax=Streptomyces TaxID=1883 RepID=UPI00047F4DFD|nr:MULTISPECIES: DUF6278 family protein [Streptomyces]MBY8865575.1 DUF6278 family protein [Streptomyces sennicomposti]